MATTLFDIAAERLEETCDLDRLAVRGTLRLALKQAGLEARNVTSDQMGVIIEKVLPGELAARGVENEAALCASLATAIKSAQLDAVGAAADSPDEVFRRLGGGS